MRKISLLVAGVCALFSVACSQQPQQEVNTSAYGTPWHWEKGTIVVDTPERPPGACFRIGNSETWCRSCWFCRTWNAWTGCC